MIIKTFSLLQQYVYYKNNHDDNCEIMIMIPIQQLTLFNCTQLTQTSQTPDDSGKSTEREYIDV